MITRKEVADRAGVSVAVVSYVLNNRSIVKEETRQKVLSVINELGLSSQSNSPQPQNSKELAASRWLSTR
jgi:DNA-binding LacI/PurR family transcriptional regulator